MPRPSSSISTTTRSRCAAHGDLHPALAGFLPAARALLGRLEAVVDAVAQDVQQRVRQLVEDGAVQLDLRAGDDQVHLALALAGDVARRARAAGR